VGKKNKQLRRVRVNQNPRKRKPKAWLWNPGNRVVPGQFGEPGAKPYSK